MKVVQGNEPLEDRFAKMVRVADRKVKMLYVESNPRWEFKFMQRAFLRDRRVDPTFLLINGDRKAMESGPPFVANFPDTRKDLFAYDLLVIGDVDANYFTAEQRNWIKDFVTEGGGLVVIAGRLHAPATWLGTPLADVLPVEVPSVKFPLDDARRPAEYKPSLSDLGRRSPILSLTDDPTEQQSTWQELPGFFWHYPVTKLRPAAVSLMDHPREKIADDKPMPLLAMHYYGKGLVLFSAVEETWRWRFNEADKYFARYWGQVVYAIGLPHTLGSKSGQLAIAGGEAVLGKPGQVYARLFTPEYRPLTSERVTAQMERLDAAAERGEVPHGDVRGGPEPAGRVRGHGPERPRRPVRPEGRERRGDGDARLPGDAAAGARTGPRPDERGRPAEAGRGDGRQVLPRGRPAPPARRRAAAEGDVHPAEGDAAVDVLAGVGGGRLPVHAGVDRAEV